MRSFKEKFIDFFKEKKNVKIVIVIAIVVLTAAGIGLGVTISSADRSSDGSSNTELTAKANTTNSTTDDTNLFNANVTEEDLAKLNATKAGGNGTSYDGSTGMITGDGSSAGVGGAGMAGVGGASNDASTANSWGTTYSSDGGSGDWSGSGEEQPRASVDCTIAIDCSSISRNGVLTANGNPQLEPYAANPSILSTRTMTISDTNGDGRVGVDEALKQACDANGIQYAFKGSSYVSAINHLKEFDAGHDSGWMYNVNGRAPNRGCNSYYLKGGEDILWYYVISY